METLTKYLGYNTYFLGTTKNVLDCLEIVLYNNSEFLNVEKISLYNIDQVYNEVLISNNYVRLTRNSNTEPFEYPTNNSGFNVIIYLSNVDDSPIGYTEFLNVQGVNKNLTIILDFKSSSLEGLDIKLVNSLSQLSNNSTIERDFIGVGLENFSTGELIQNKIDQLDNYSRYTVHIKEILKFGNRRNIYLNYGAVKGDTITRLNIVNNLNIDPYRLNFPNIQINYYGNDIVASTWDGLKFSIFSLTVINKLGNPKIYTVSLDGYWTLPIYDSKFDQKIEFFSGKYIFTSLIGQNRKIIYDIELLKWIDTESDYYVNQWDPQNKLIKLPKILSYANLIKAIPNLVNVSFPIEDYSKTSSIFIEKSVGDWFVIRVKKVNEKDLIIYSNYTTSIVSCELDNLMIINDKLLTNKYQDEKLNYHTLYKTPGIIYTEAAKSLVDSTELVFDEELNIYVSLSRTEVEKNELYGVSGILKVIRPGDENSVFLNFRKDLIKSSEIPDIIASIRGILFYKEENYLNYL